MTQYNSLNVKLSNLQLNKLKCAIKNETEIGFKLSSNMIGNSDDENSFFHELLLTNRQVPNLRKSFANNSSTSIKLSGGFLGRLSGALLKTRLPLIKNVIKLFAKKF